MFENIKRIINEHQTLIVVVISVLVICFIYWWFCCKDIPLANKVKGGGNPTYDDACVIGNARYMCIGARCDYICETVQDKYYRLIILNDTGITKLKTIINKIKDFRLGIYLTFCIHNMGLENDDGDKNITIKPLIKDPIKLFEKTAKRSDLNYKYPGHFFLGNTLKPAKNFRNDINQNYYKLISEVVEKYRSCFDYVTYVGQCGCYPIPDNVNVKPDNDIIYSKAASGVLDNNTNLKYIFNYFVHNDQDVRQWYKSNGIKKSEMVNKFFNDDDTGNIIKVDDDDEYYILYAKLIDFICDTIKKYVFESYNSIYKSTQTQIYNIQQWIETNKITNIDKPEPYLKNIVKDICGDIYNKNFDKLTIIFREVALFNIMQDMEIIKKAMMDDLSSIYTNVRQYILK